MVGPLVGGAGVGIGSGSGRRFIVVFVQSVPLLMLGS